VCTLPIYPRTRLLLRRLKKACICQGVVLEKEQSQATGKFIITRYNWSKEMTMKKLIVPLTLFILGLFVAQYFFGIDIKGLTEGFVDFLVEILNGPG
jgi:hypothetical protein